MAESQTSHWTDTWGGSPALSHCQICDGSFVVPLSLDRDVCPYCGQAVWTYMDEVEDTPAYTQPPELAVPFAVTPEQCQQHLTEFIKKSWFAPADLTPETVNGRLLALYLPVWLVDATAAARWQAEVGFDYEIVSHREKYANGDWQSERIQQTKVRWEPRVGELNRRYDNRSAPALEEHPQWQNVLGRFQLEAAVAYQPDLLANAAVRLPNRPPDDAWPDAEASLKTAAAAECRQAARADHIRQFRWSATYQGYNWTQLLLPIFTTYYRDDDGQTRMIYIHGQTGKTAGQRRASLKKARKWAIGIGLAAAALFIFSLILAGVGLLEAAVLPFAGMGLMASLGLGISAVLPLLIATAINRFGFFTDKDQDALAALAAAMQAR